MIVAAPLEAFASLDGTSKLVVIGIVVALGYLVHLRLFPDKKCKRCGGAGSWGPGNSLRGCGRCGGSGRERRLFARRD